jgi:16S rRNA processing protein RimM
MDVVVARLGRPQGLRGEVTVEVRTDEPERRLAVGSVLLTRLADLSAPPAGDLPATLTVRDARMQGNRLILAFEGFEDRTAAERLRDLLVAVEVDPADRPEDDDEFYDHQLVGLEVRTLDDVTVGTVSDVLHLPSQDVLVVARADQPELLVPFVAAIVPSIDLATRVVSIDPPPGLLGEEDDEVAEGTPSEDPR